MLGGSMPGDGTGDDVPGEERSDVAVRWFDGIIGRTASSKMKKNGGGEAFS